MILRGLLVFLLLVSLPCLADDLDDGAALCIQHRHEPPPPPPDSSLQRLSVPASAQLPTYDTGFEDCAAIVHTWTDRKIARDAADEATNPDLKKIHDLAKSLRK